MKPWRTSSFALAFFTKQNVRDVRASSTAVPRDVLPGAGGDGHLESLQFGLFSAELPRAFVHMPLRDRTAPGRRPSARSCWATS